MIIPFTIDKKAKSNIRISEAAISETIFVDAKTFQLRTMRYAEYAWRSGDAAAHLRRSLHIAATLAVLMLRMATASH